MVTLKSLLAPTDFSEPSRRAVVYAAALAERFGAVLHLLHVTEEPLLLPPADEAYIPPPIDFAEMERQAGLELQNIATAHPQLASVELAVRRGTPFVEIVRYAAEQKIDLIVMGTHGRGPIAHMLMGSVAEKVVRKAPCPVLTVGPVEREFVMP